jgi:hypothetical protein
VAAAKRPEALRAPSLSRDRKSALADSGLAQEPVKSRSMGAVLASAADEGRNIILSMLVVGLIFLAVIALGELNDWRARKRHHRRASSRNY